jgi:hypothetical protein
MIYYIAHSALTDEELRKRQYALPEKRKFPLPDRAHVMSAIRFFNYVSPQDESRLARAILKRMRELGISDVNVGPENRFRKYYESSTVEHSDKGIKMEYLLSFDDGSEAFLAHYGIKGMKWGKWNAETRARYTGAGNGTFYKKATHGDKYGKSVTDLRRAYNANQPKSKQIAKNVLLGPMGAHAYNTARSRGLSRSDSLHNVPLGVFYAQGVKHKQKKLGTTNPKISAAAKERADYTRDESLGKSAAKEILTAGNTVAYNTVKARTKSRGKAALAAVGIAVASGVAGGVAGSTLALPGMASYAMSTTPAAATASAYAANVGNDLGRLAGQYTPNAIARVKQGSSRQVDAPKFKRRKPEK